MLPQFRYKCKQALCTPINNAHLGFSESSKIVVSSVHSLLSKNGKKIACHLLYIPKSYTFLHFPTLADALETRSGSDFPTLPTLTNAPETRSGSDFPTLPTLSYGSYTFPTPRPEISASRVSPFPRNSTNYNLFLCLKNRFMVVPINLKEQLYEPFTK